LNMAVKWTMSIGYRFSTGCRSCYLGALRS